MSESELLYNLRTARLIKEPCDGIWVEYQHACGKPYVTVDWATVQAAIKELSGQIEQLQAVVDKLPKCWRLDESGVRVRDVPVAPDQVVYYYRNNMLVDGVVLSITWGDSFCECLVRNCYGITDVLDNGNCYSTREAAEAARKEAGS
ncbi:hypothetical protein LCGC14_1042550 [marine sediment metagenome]|uniref:Uncharacterized protein n=1 Tax=marine sediment metagenome TaxID=412755 RepID=A0A0F9ND14_9ZZZZ